VKHVSHFIIETVELSHSAGAATAKRTGFRARFAEAADRKLLAKVVAGQIPYFYRQPAKIAADFVARRDALEMIYDLTTKVPTSPKFQNSHFGEILSALYLEDVLQLRRLYCKLTLLTAENTNAHKMDGLFVNTATSPFSYFWVEAKTSILPTSKTRFTGHRHGILRQLIESLDGYGEQDKRFDFVAIRDNLDSAFNTSEAAQITDDLVPPGPAISYLGMAAINDSTTCTEDDDWILSASCKRTFAFRGLTVTDLACCARTAYSEILKLTEKN
jgi:hypothetical protein